MSKVTISHKAIIKRKSLIIIMIIYGYKLDSPVGGIKIAHI